MGNETSEDRQLYMAAASVKTVYERVQQSLGYEDWGEAKPDWFTTCLGVLRGLLEERLSEASWERAMLAGQELLGHR